MEKIFTAKHAGDLKECIETEQKITINTFYKLIDSGVYIYYAYDERIKAHRYLLDDMENNIGLPQWIHYYEE